MFTFLADLFATKPSARKSSSFRPDLTTMEERDAPALLSPGSIYAFNPQPEPPMWAPPSLSPPTR